MSHEIATARVNARLGLVDEEDLAGEAADGRRGGALEGAPPAVGGERVERVEGVDRLCERFRRGGKSKILEMKK